MENQWRPDQLTLLLEQQRSSRESLDSMREEFATFRTEVFKKIDEGLKDKVSKDQFEPVRLIVYGLVGSILLATLTGVLAVVIGKGSGHP